MRAYARRGERAGDAPRAREVRAPESAPGSAPGSAPSARTFARQEARRKARRRTRRVRARGRPWRRFSGRGPSRSRGARCLTARPPQAAGSVGRPPHSQQLRGDAPRLPSLEPKPGAALLRKVGLKQKRERPALRENSLSRRRSRGGDASRLASYLPGREGEKAERRENNLSRRRSRAGDASRLTSFLPRRRIKSVSLN